MKYEKQKFYYGVVERFLPSKGSFAYAPSIKKDFIWTRLIASFANEADAFVFKKAIRKDVGNTEHTFFVVTIADGKKVKKVNW